MVKINENFLKLQSSYLFAKIQKSVDEFQSQEHGKKIIKMGIGDVTNPLPRACVDAFAHGVREMGEGDSFRGYGPYEGFEFLREAIAKGDFKVRGVDVKADEIFVSDGAKSDSANISEIFSDKSTIALPDPVYPVYVDSNVIGGRTGICDSAGRYDGIVYIEGSEENNFAPPPSKSLKADIIYLCFPNNPTGATATRELLSEWVGYALKNRSLIIYDAAYEAFIQDSSLPKSIFEVPGAEEVAIEIRSFSKTAGFTGTRCAYMVIRKECRVSDSDGNLHSVKDLWLRRQSTKFNGVSYPVQRAAEAVFSSEGKKEIASLIAGYMLNAKIIREAFNGWGFTTFGGENSPYIWVKTGEDSWKAFDRLLDEAGVVVTPGSGFGACGEGYIRISAFNTYENVQQALERLGAVYS